jgi:hypothetical protein
MMDSRRVSSVAALLLLLLPIGARADDEKAFWEVWTLHGTSPDQHQAVMAACEAFEQAAPADPLVIVTRQLHAWHLLEQGETHAAAAILAPMIKRGATGLDKAASDIARAWLTCLDRERVKAALQAVYARHVAYPSTLDVWQTRPTETPPLTDRWDKPWTYRLVGFRHLKGMLDQKYTLSSPILGDDSDLAAALARPYADRIRLTPIRLKPMQSAPPLVEFTTGQKTGPALLAVETRYEQIQFAYMGNYIILLADRFHWKALPKPR